VNRQIRESVLNGSVLGLGFPAESHAFASWYYMPDSREGMRAGLDRARRGETQWRGLAADLAEEVHKYVVSNARTGFDAEGLRAAVGVGLDAAMPALATAIARGWAWRDGDTLRTTLDRPLHQRVARWFFYSPMVQDRVRHVWGSAYDPRVDYVERLSLLLDADA
jgi:hypothetical protein